jgi:DNA polymerase elongation subunit (family B)
VKLLTLDIETSPSLAYVWRLFKENIPLARLVETGEVICVAAKWHGSDEVMFFSTFHDGKQEMLNAIYNLLSEADAVITYNGKKFDIPHLNREFILAGMTPPAPYAQIDLYWTARQKFNFISNKLDNIAQELGIGAKFEHAGFQLWIDCMKGDADAWEQMKTYNMQDVVLTEKLYDRMLPWIASHPTAALYVDPEAPDAGKPACPNCASTKLKPRGRAYTSVTVFQRYRCDDCGKWSRSGSRIEGVTVRGMS